MTTQLQFIIIIIIIKEEVHTHKCILRMQCTLNELHDKRTVKTICPFTPKKISGSLRPKEIVCAFAKPLLGMCTLVVSVGGQ